MLLLRVPHMSRVNEALSRVFEADDNPLAQCIQRGLDFFRLRIMLRIEHPPYDGFAHTESPGQLRIANRVFTHRQVERELRGEIEWHANRMLASLNAGW